MAINFPDSPTLNDEFTAAGRTWIWDGSVWVSAPYADDIVATVTAAIVDSAPETLDTLNELAAALGDDANFATTVTNALALKVDETNGAVTTASPSLTVVRNITLSTSDPTGGADGDVWLKYTA